MNRTIKIYVDGNLEEITEMFSELKDYCDKFNTHSLSVEEVDIE